MLSMVALVSTIVVWGRSCIFSDGINLYAGKCSCHLTSCSGLSRAVVRWNDQTRFSLSQAFSVTHVRGWASDGLDIRLASRPSAFKPQFLVEGGGNAHHRWIEVRLPLWFLCLVAAVAPLTGFSRRWRQQKEAATRKQHGLCLACGYDIRTTPHRCPECGHEANACE